MSLSVKVLEPFGILNSISAKRLRSDVSNLLESGANVVLIDLRDVNFIDSAGIGCLVSAMKMVQNAEGRLFVCSAKDQVKMVLELTKMNNMLDIFADRDEFNRQVLAIE